MAKYRVKSGKHFHRLDGSRRIVRTGEVFESEIDWVARDSNKFEVVMDVQPPKQEAEAADSSEPAKPEVDVDPEIAALKLDELKKLAEESGIDVAGMKKAEVAQALQSHFDAQS